MKIGIYSLGLIGGSLLKVLFNKGYELYAVTRNQQTIEAAKTYTNNVSSDINTLKQCEVVFVCSPMSKTMAVLDELEGVVSSNTIVADVCSLKEFVMKKPRPYVFIGSHPMAGTENSGFNASFEELFVDAKWVLTPSEKVSQTDIEKLVNIIETTGAKTLIATPVALISHMPMLVAQALVKTAMPDSLAVKLASSGFRDTTRLALSNIDMATDMIELNNDNIKEALNALVNNADVLLNSDYQDSIKYIKDFRSAMYNSNGKNISN